MFLSIDLCVFYLRKITCNTEFKKGQEDHIESVRDVVLLVGMQCGDLLIVVFHMCIVSGYAVIVPGYAGIYSLNIFFNKGIP